MPSKAPDTGLASLRMLKALSLRIRTTRKSLRISTVVAAYAAGVSRVTWHRIESAEPSVTIGAYMGALAALGLNVEIKPSVGPKDAIERNVVIGTEIQLVAESIPNKIPIQDYPQLRQIAWHVRDGFELTPNEAAGLYDRYRRDLNFDQMEPHELSLIRALEKLPMREPDAVQA